MRDNLHISDEELLQAADGEIPARRAAQVQSHLEACWRCRARRAKIERSIAGFMHAHFEGAPDDVPSIEGPRALLRARLDSMAPEKPGAWGYVRRFTSGRLTAGIAASAVVAALGFGLLVDFPIQRVNASTPDTRLTPGATRAVNAEDICPARTADGFYPIPSTLAYRVFEKYGIRNPRPRSYEVDYLITPALGGADDIRNLWPQPYNAGDWNAHVKDALEDHLHRLVCRGDLELAVAQQDISSNWILAYKKYFQTETPLAAHAEFTKDPPWED